MNYVFFYLSLLFGFITVILTNPIPHYIIKHPNLIDIYVDDKNNKYKYRLKYIKNK